jgi:hypothetical protein
MTLINPFEEVVVFGKAYSLLDVKHGTDVRNVAALLPTGRHVGTANALVRVTGPRSGGPATKLERYSKASVEQGLKMIAAAPKPTKVAAQTFSTKTPRLGALAARKANAVGNAARSNVFGSAGSSGRRVD